MFKRALMLIGLLFILSLAACSDDNVGDDNNSETSDTQIQWSMGTSSSGSSPYVLGGAITQLINGKSSFMTLSPQVTGGYEENISLTTDGSVNVSQATLDQLNYVYHGKERFEGSSQENLRALFNSSLMPLHLAVLDSSDIHSYEDLEGKRINVAAPQQATHTLAIKYLEAIGLSEDDITTGLLSTSEAPNALKDGQQDAIFLASTLPLPGLVEIAVSHPIRLINIDGEIANKFIELIEGAAVKTTIPANTYEGQTNDVETIASPIVLYVDESASEEEVYEFTKIFWDNLELLHEEFPGSQSLTRDLALEGIDIPIHPGAEKYFKEEGILE